MAVRSGGRQSRRSISLSLRKNWNSKECADHEITGLQGFPALKRKEAARLPVRPKSREETPKEGNETIARLVRHKVDVRRTKRNRIFLHCRTISPA